MGLLDQYEGADISQGLLQFGQLASQKRPFLGLLAGLAAADRSVAGRTEAARQREMEERKMRMEEEMRRMQMEGLQQQKAERDAALAAQNRRQSYLGAIDSSQGPALPLSAPQALASGLSLQEIGALTPQRRKVARTEVIAGPDGRPMIVQLDDEGQKIGESFGKAYTREMKDTGGTLVPVDPYTQVDPIRKTMTPDGQASNAVALANLGIARERLNMDRAGGGEKAPSGYRFKQDGSLEAIPGGPADLKAGEAGAKAEARRQAGLAGADNVLDAIADAKKAVGINTAGVGSMLSSIPGTPARNLAATLETVKANFGFDRLQQMREASPTGGALGQVAVQELTALQATVASLDQAQSPAQLAARLDKAQRHYENWKKTLGGETAAPKVRKYNPETGRIE